MTKRAHRALAIMLALTLAGSAAALAAGPLKGKSYKGSAPSSGTDVNGHHARTHATGNIIIRVAASGRSVTVRFSSSVPISYCYTAQKLLSQSTKAASISSHGTFTARIGERFAAGPGPPPIVQVVTGKFSGRIVRGTIHTEVADCGGVASYSATAP